MGARPPGVTTYVTRVVVTQADDYEPPEHDITAPPRGKYRVWVMEWTQVRNGREESFKHPQYSIVSARRMTTNLLAMRPPDTSVEDVLTLTGFDDEG